MSDAGEISRPLRKRPPQETTSPQWNWSRLIPVFVPNLRHSRGRSLKADSKRTTRAAGPISELEVLAGWHLAAHNITGYETQFRFHPERRWLFDFAWPDQKVALEIEGAIWVKGGHSTGTGILRDMEKYNEAQCMGWTVIRAAKEHLDDGRMVDWVKRALWG